jgi:hypothetical protein
MEAVSRWADPTYADVYSAIFSGAPSLHDLYDLSLRQYANSALFPGTSSSVLRAFQGWTAITSAGPREGSLLLYPHVQAPIAYTLLRPFFNPPEDTDAIMDAEKWTLDESGEGLSFPGTYTDKPQMLSPNAYPHLRLEECMTCIPRMEPGDTVWWHADVSILPLSSPFLNPILLIAHFLFFLP